MQNPAPTDTSRQLGKLIAALQKQWQQELGVPEAVQTREALEKARRLLASLTAGNTRITLGGLSLGDYLGADWLAGNPWARLHIDRLEAMLAHDTDQT